MTDERKRELEKQLNGIMKELRDIVLETGYGYSIMVLPFCGTVSNCVYIHEASPGNGIIRVDDTFDGVLDKEFEHDEAEVSE